MNFKLIQFLILKRNMRADPAETLTGAAIIVIIIREPIVEVVLQMKQPELVTNFAYLSCHAITFLGSARTPHIL